MSSPGNSLIGIDSPLLVGIAIIAGPNLQFNAVLVVTVWDVETFIAENLELGDRACEAWSA